MSQENVEAVPLYILAVSEENQGATSRGTRRREWV